MKNKKDNKIKKIILLLIMALSLGISACCEWEEEEIQNNKYKQAYFNVQYPGSYYIFFYNTDKNEKGHLFITECKENKTYTESDLIPLIMELNILNIRICKITGENYPDYGDLIFSIYNEGQKIDTIIIPLGETETEIDYIF